MPCQVRRVEQYATLRILYKRILFMSGLCVGDEQQAISEQEETMKLEFAACAIKIAPSRR